MKRADVLFLIIVLSFFFSCKTISPANRGGVKMEENYASTYTGNCMTGCLDDGLGVLTILDVAVDLVTFRWLWDHRGMPFNGLINMVLKTVAILPFYVHHDENSLIYGSAYRGESRAEDYDAVVDQYGGGSSYNTSSDDRCYCVKWPEVGWACYPQKDHAKNEFKRCNDGYGNCQYKETRGDDCFRAY